MGIEKFEDIIAWQKAKEMTILIYNDFKDSKDFGFKDQIQGAGVSVMNNIAEGFDQKKYQKFFPDLSKLYNLSPMNFSLSPFTFYLYKLFPL